MKLEELLHVKALTSVLPIKARLSSNNQNNSVRMRLIIGTDAFKILYNPGKDGISPRSDTYGDAYSGLIVCLSPQGSAKVDQNTKSTVYFNFTAKAVAAVENAVASTEIDAVIATYEDGTKYLLTGPLPDNFLATSVRERRRKDEQFRPLKAAVIAFDYAKLKMPDLHPGRPTTEEVTPQKIETTAQPPATPLVSEPPAPPAPSAHIETATGAIASDFFDKFKDGAKSINDIGEMLKMLNAEAERLRETGAANIAFRVDGEGQVRASAQVAASFEL